MYKKFIFAFCTICCFFICGSGCVSASVSETEDISYSSEVDSSSNSEVERMSTEEKFGQMMCLDFRAWEQENAQGELDQRPVLEINADIKKAITDYHIGSVILFSENFESEEQSKKLIDDLQQASADAGNPPLLICVDQEGGLVERFSFGRNRLKNNMALQSADEAFEKGLTIGKELKGLGINCNFAPVVDINSNPNNPVIGVRSFGETAEIVSERGLAFMRGLHEEGIIATAKHFPGHGDTDVDSHIGLPRVNKSLSELENFELKPFKTLIDAGVDMIMTAHIELPQVDSTTIISKKDGEEIFLPATLSKTVLTDLLRNELNFNGVIITDAMNMKAISENVGEAEATKMAIAAGADMVCMPAILRSPQDTYKLDEIYQTLNDALDSGEISTEQLDSSITRILELKSNL